MICLQTVKQFCKEYWKVENYDQAVADKEQTWHCHHRHEIDWALPKEELISVGRYYDVHYSELIFLTPEEHKRLHMKGNTWNKGNQNHLKHHITADELYDLYVVQGLSTYKIADLYGCSNQCIWLKLKKYNIKK